MRIVASQQQELRSSAWRFPFVAGIEEVFRLVFPNLRVYATAKLLRSDQLGTKAGCVLTSSHFHVNYISCSRFCGVTYSPWLMKDNSPRSGALVFLQKILKFAV